MPSIFGDEGFYVVYLANEDISDENAEDIASNFESYEEARATADRLTQETDRGVYIYEAAVFKFGRSKKEEMILFWWNKVYAEALEEMPRGRGHGYYLSKKQEWSFVRYIPDPAFGERQADEADDEEQEEEYVKTNCESCGKIMPLYEAREYEMEQEVGRSSGSSRFGRTSSRRSSSKGYTSYASGSSASNSSGRTYYRTINKVLCEDCYKAQSSADWIWLALKWGILCNYWLSCSFCH